ncbi:MAG: phenylalanine--tRNA ligase subunit beta, partial [Flavobacteriales bacterium]|nr:phenylalanine--tRNA ligase subunit beta [Flavobacteriales bacterium]
FERGCDPDKTPWALKRAVALMLDIAGGEATTGWQDIYPQPMLRKEVILRWHRLELLSGKKFDRDKVRRLLVDLHMEVISENQDAVTLGIPLYRVDVTREVDVIEDILRIVGYNSVEIPSRMSATPSVALKPDPETLQYKVSSILAANGFAEMMAMSLTKTAWAEHLQAASGHSLHTVVVRNPLSSDLGIMRPSLLPGILEAIAHNQNYKASDLRLFEFGNSYFGKATGYGENKALAMAMCGRRDPESWNNNDEQANLIDLRQYCDVVLASLGMGHCRWVAGEHPYLDNVLVGMLGKETLVYAGMVKPGLLGAADIAQPVWYAEFQWHKLLNAVGKISVSWKPVARYPEVRRDLSLLLDTSVSYADIERVAMETEKKLLRSVNLFDVYEGKNLEAGKKSYAVSFVLQDSQKTMTDTQVEGVMNAIQRALEEKLGARLRA